MFFASRVKAASPSASPEQQTNSLTNSGNPDSDMPSDRDSVDGVAGDGDGRRRRRDADLGRISSSTNSIDSNGDEFQPFASSEWQNPHGTRRRSSRFAFQQKNSKSYPFQTNPMLDSLQVPSAPFSFQRRRARIDWRSLHSIDVDQIVRETDIVKLESVLDTVAFGDIQGEDIRNFTEANFVKLFRLSQLMVEYLLHMQELFLSQKSRLLEAGGSLFKRAEKFRLRCIWQHEALWQSRRDLKQVKKTLRTYESLLRSQGHAPTTNTATQQPKQAHYCPFCDKVFESSLYLDMHISRRHSLLKEQTTEATKRTESLRHRNALPSQDDHRHDSCVNSSQVTSLQMALKESNNKLRDVQQQLDNLQRTVQNPKPSRKDAADKIEGRKARAAQEKLQELEVKFGDFESQIKQLGEENAKLLKELNAAYSEVSGLKSEKRRFILSMDRHDEQVEELQQEIEELRRTIKKDYGQIPIDKRSKPIKDWLHEAEDFRENQSRLRHEESMIMAKSQASKKKEFPYIETISRQDTALTADAFTDAEEDIPPDKEEWLKLHPYTPIQNLPYVVAKYPHSPTLFLSKRNEVSRRLDKMLRDELQKFGIPPNAEGLSDAKYAVVAAALEKQRGYRLSAASLSDQKIMEFERSTILWQIERAVHSRDMSILESIFDEETESTSRNDETLEDPQSDNEDIRQSPGHSHRKGGDSEFEVESSAKRSMSRQGSEQSDLFRSREASQHSDALVMPKNLVSRCSTDNFETQTFQVVGQLTTQRVPSLSDETKQCNLILSAVSSPVAIMPQQNFEQLEDELGLGDWESDGEASSFMQSSPRRSAKDDAASGSSKNTAKFSDIDRRASNL